MSQPIYVHFKESDLGQIMLDPDGEVPKITTPTYFWDMIPACIKAYEAHKFTLKDLLKLAKVMYENEWEEFAACLMLKIRSCAEHKDQTASLMRHALQSADKDLYHFITHNLVKFFV